VDKAVTVELQKIPGKRKQKNEKP
jgi:hypothetical protein